MAAGLASDDPLRRAVAGGEGAQIDPHRTVEIDLSGMCRDRLLDPQIGIFGAGGGGVERRRRQRSNEANAGAGRRSPIGQDAAR